jgi:DNA mismatch repair protein MSH6
MSDTAVAKSPGLAEDEEDSGGDSTEDEDWKRDTVAEDVSEEVELEEEEEEEEEVAVRSRKGKTRNSLPVSGSTPLTLGSGLTSASGSTISKKRKKVDVGSLDCAKKFSFEAVNTTGKVDPEVPLSCGRSKQWNLNSKLLMSLSLAVLFVI